MDQLPDVTVTATDGAPLRLHDQPRPIVIYFYPKDDTAGCTREAQEFSALIDDFRAAGVGVLGISRDTPKRHASFTAKYDLAVPLASDEEGAACAAFGVWLEKSMYGRQYMGIERSTFLFGSDGALVQAWRKVKVPGHAAAVLEAARAL
ncbi:peroxiredoxin [Sphingomonas sp. NBWT7]|uniref:peroxiredoxin n=1 Tax=Sphingomonas sp. NBWT7 TaxID=2596913 RepID=UPI0016239F1D|nr:peroxiredoxin [Sphingomonas sp. NBWT7]QNE30541.1 peroxiredoxin [Sphingomonas sp. NBWT7]